jgi:hypothetical protein
VVGYTLGKKIVECDDKSCYAKCDEDNKDFFLLANMHGELYNPNGLYAEQRDNHGIPNWEFRRVHKSVFDRYVRFLETRNETHLTLASREYLNA